MIYTHDTGAPLTKEQWDYNFQQLSLRYTLATGKPMPVTLRQNLSRPLTNREADTNFQNLDAALMRLEYGDGPYPVLDQTFVGASFLDPRFTFSRSGKSWRTVNGVLREYDVNEPVLTPDGWPLRPAETNLAANVSQWALVQSSRTSSSVPVPTSTPATFYKLVESSAIEQHYTSSQNRQFTAGKKYSASLLVKAGERTFGHLSFPGEAFAPGRRAAFDLINGVVTEAQSGVVGKVVRLAGDVFEISISATATSTATAGYGVAFGLMPSGNLTSLGYQGDGTSGAYIWGGQINEGDPIPYIPTTTGAVTRPAENASIQGASFVEVFNPVEGAIVWDGTLTSMSKFPEYFRFRNNTGSWSMFAFLSHSDGRMYLAATSVEGVNTTRPIDQTKNWSGIPVKLALAWTPSGEIHVFLNGIKKLTHATTLNFEALNNLVSNQVVAGRNSKNIRRLRIFTRRLADAMLEALTS